MPEQVALYPEQTVRSLLEFVAVIKGVPKQDRRTQLQEIDDAVELGAAGDRGQEEEDRRGAAGQGVLR